MIGANAHMFQECIGVQQRSVGPPKAKTQMLLQIQEVGGSNSINGTNSADINEFVEPWSSLNESSDITSPRLTKTLSGQFYKTRMCPYYLSGYCRKGAACTYAHKKNELNTAPDLFKTKICPNWQKGACKIGSTCRFAHGWKELRCTDHFYKTRICHFWLAGDCNKGKTCRHAHGFDELQASPNKKTLQCVPQNVMNDEIYEVPSTNTYSMLESIQFSEQASSQGSISNDRWVINTSESLGDPKTLQQPTKCSLNNNSASSVNLHDSNIDVHSKTGRMINDDRGIKSISHNIGNVLLDYGMSSNINDCYPTQTSKAGETHDDDELNFQNAPVEKTITELQASSDSILHETLKTADINRFYNISKDISEEEEIGSNIKTGSALYAHDWITTNSCQTTNTTYGLLPTTPPVSVTRRRRQSTHSTRELVAPPPHSITVNNNTEINSVASTQKILASPQPSFLTPSLTWNPLRPSNITCSATDFYSQQSRTKKEQQKQQSSSTLSELQPPAFKDASCITSNIATTSTTSSSYHSPLQHKAANTIDDFDSFSTMTDVLDNNNTERVPPSNLDNGQYQRQPPQLSGEMLSLLLQAIDGLSLKQDQTAQKETSSFLSPSSSSPSYYHGCMSSNDTPLPSWQFILQQLVQTEQFS